MLKELRPHTDALLFSRRREIGVLERGSIRVRRLAQLRVPYLRGAAVAVDLKHPPEGVVDKAIPYRGSSSCRWG